MADAILLTGKRGEGKSLTAVKMIQRRLSKGRVVATNLNLNLDKLCFPWSTASVIRLPDIPSYQDFLNLPAGNPKPTDEKRNGLLVLDECVNFLNSREWQDKDRPKLISWLSQSRKDGWDLLLIAQGSNMIDAQIRTSLCDLLGVAKRSDKVGIPFVTWFFLHFFDMDVKMPKLHVVTFFYGFAKGSPVSHTEIFSGSDIYECYDTIQKINPLCRDPNSDQMFGSGMATMLPAWHLRGRYMGKLRMYAKIAALMLCFGLLVGGAIGYFAGYTHKSKKPDISPQVINQSVIPDDSLTISGVMELQSGDYVLTLSNGRIETAKDYKFDSSGRYFKVNNKWLKVQS